MFMFITLRGSTSRAEICVACLKLTTLPRRIVHRIYMMIDSQIFFQVDKVLYGNCKEMGLISKIVFKHFNVNLKPKHHFLFTNNKEQ